MTVAGRWPERNACTAVTISAGLRPVSRSTGVSTDRDPGWQPEQDEAPGGASAAIAPPNGSQSSATQTAVRFEIMPARLAKSWNRRGAAVARRSV
jgi:hypothetical protein